MIRVVLAVSFVTATAAWAADPKVVEGPARVIDGNTLAIGEKTLHLAGIAAPGPRQKCLDGQLPWLCGAAARAHLVELIDDRPVSCIERRPGLALCRTPDGDLSAAMVRDGWAVPDSHGKAYRTLEAEARRERRGLWEKMR
ncbi:MAG: thermonuclease family protein [Alphaproteobacteria bacterium]|nr:thermonuclease family protein [Alphaproteobacteria bacterium]